MCDYYTCQVCVFKFARSAIVLFGSSVFIVLGIYLLKRFVEQCLCCIYLDKQCYNSNIRIEKLFEIYLTFIEPYANFKMTSVQIFACCKWWKCI